jgi:general secretion pathway protein F
MLFKYKKLTKQGAVVSGVADYSSLKEAQYHLIQGGELLLELKTLKSKKETKLNSEELFEFTYQMHQLLAAGLPIYESLLSLKEKRVKYSDLLEKMAEKIKEGFSLSKVMADYPECFDVLYLAIIQASEVTGEIKEGFAALKSLLEKRAKILKILKNALIYPAILTVFAFLIVNGLIFFIIPSLKDLFEGRELSSLTQTILTVSNICNENIFLLLIFLILGTAATAYLAINGLLKKATLSILELVPFCRELTLALKLENFFSCLSLLLKRAINLKESLTLARNVLEHELLASKIDKAIEHVLKGNKFSTGLGPPFPYVAIRLISLAEETGKLQEACERLSQIFQEDVEKKLSQLTAFLQPALLALIGLIVGLVVLSILLPLTDVGGFI